jgi:hypothetical protein
MRRQMRFYTGILILVLFACSCRKSATPENTKDYSSMIRNRNWWGTITYTGESLKYFSVHFNDDSTLIWDEDRGTFTGHWTLIDRQLIVKFDSSGYRFTANIENEKFSYLASSSPKFQVNSGQLIKDLNLSIENTTWIGPGYVPEILYVMQFSPEASYKLDDDKYGNTRELGHYIILPSGGGLKMQFQTYTGHPYNLSILIFTSGTEMVGSVEGYKYFTLTKQ